MRRISTSAEHRAAGQAHARDSGTAQPRRFPGIDLALLPVNGLAIRPFNRQVVMSAEEAGEFCSVLRPAVAVPTHYAFTADPVMRWMWPEPSAYTLHFPRLVVSFGGKAFDEKTAWALPDTTAVARISIRAS